MRFNLRPCVLEQCLTRARAGIFVDGRSSFLRRSLHLAPPFLLDDYVPRYMTLSSVDAAKKRSQAYAHLRNCNLCPRLCGINRFERTGVCLVGATAKVNVIAPHFGEEPCIQGHNGSGAVFFSGCNLRCVFCQNYDIAHKPNGMDLAPEDLGDWYIKLQEVGNVHNVNLITPEHVVPQVVLSILHAADRGLKLPIVYNTSAYDSLESLKLLDGLVDIYLPDFKAWDPETSRRLLKAHDYSATARESVREMHRQVGDLCFTRDGLAKRGLLVRHLVMPGKQDEGKQIMRWLADEVSTDVFVNIMEQYHPDAHVGKPKGRRRVSGERKEEEKEVEEEAGDAAVVSKADPGGVRYAEINRAASEHEISSIRRAAEVAGLWRFCDPPGHDGFNI